MCRSSASSSRPCCHCGTSRPARPACSAPSRCSSRRSAAGSPEHWPTAVGRGPACCRSPLLWDAFLQPPDAASRRTSRSSLHLPRSCRVFGFGGEWAAGAALMGEAIRDKDPRLGRRAGADRTGGRAGAPRRHLHRAVRLAAGGAGVAGTVLDRHLCPPASSSFIRRYVEEPEIAPRGAPATSLGLAHVIPPAATAASPRGG